MNTIEYICQLSWHSNIETYTYRDKHIILYDDHRCILNVIFEAMKLNVFDGQIPNIIYFDHHDDACYTDVRLDNYHVDDILKLKSRDFWPIVEFDLSALDDDWVTAGMELGLINNVVCIGNEENHNIDGWSDNTYTTATGKGHKGYCISHLKRETNNRGILGDSILKYPYYKDVRDVFGYVWGKNNLQPQNPYILDFDLDCFTTDFRDKTFAWPEYFFKDEFWPDNNFDYRLFIEQLIEKASIITICREPKCCGGIGESNKILSHLDRYLFGGALKTEPIH